MTRSARNPSFRPRPPADAPAATPPLHQRHSGDSASAWRAGRKRLRDHDVKRDAVVRTAARAFAERGFHNTSLDDIAKALDVTKPTIYYYVTNKEELLFQCFVTGLEPIRAALRAVKSGEGAGARAAEHRAPAVRAGGRFRFRLVHGDRRAPGPLGLR